MIGQIEGCVEDGVNGVADNLVYHTAVVSHGAGDRIWNPASAAELRGTYRLGAGDGRLDLSAIHDLHGTRHVEVSVGLGDLRVTLPSGVPVTVQAHAGVGDVTVLGHEDSGVDTTVTRTVDGDGDGRLVLDLRVGAGDLTVNR